MVRAHGRTGAKTCREQEEGEREGRAGVKAARGVRSHGCW
jgi:hypothetical protein